MVVSYGRFSENYLFHLQDSSSPRKTALPLKMGLICCPKTPVRNYHFALRKVPKEGISHLHDGGSLKSRVLIYYFQLWWDRILVFWRKLLLSGPCGKMLLFSTFIPSVHINTELLLCFKAETFQLAAHLHCQEGIHYSCSDVEPYS